MFGVGSQTGFEKTVEIEAQEPVNVLGQEKNRILKNRGYNAEAPGSFDC